MKKEIWKSVKGYEGLYSVSNTGKVKSESRTRNRSNRYAGFTYRTKEKILNPVLKKGTGYIQYSLYKNGQQKLALVHILVAQSFIKNPESKPQVNHKNGIRTDNSVENLEWCTPSENLRHAYDVLGIKTITTRNFLVQNTTKVVV